MCAPPAFKPLEYPAPMRLKCAFLTGVMVVLPLPALAQTPAADGNLAAEDEDAAASVPAMGQSEDEGVVASADAADPAALPVIPGVRELGASMPPGDSAQAPPRSALVTLLPDWRREDLYLRTPLEMARQAPNMVAVKTPGFGSGAIYRLRALGDVGVYVDGIRLSEETARNMGHFDLERVDIVRGPAPTMFALPSSAGAIDARLHRPGGDPYGEFELSWGRFDHWLARASIDMHTPSKVVGINVSGYFEDSDGDTTGLFTGDRLNEDDRYGGRVGIAVMPSADFRLDLGLAYLRDNSLNIFSRECGDLCDERYSATGFTVDVPAPIGSAGGFPIDGDKARFGLGNEAETVLLTGDMSWRTGIGNLRIVAGHVSTGQEFGVDFADGSNVRTLSNPLPAAGGFALGGDLRLGDNRRNETTIDGSLQLPQLVSGVTLTLGATGHKRRNVDDVARIVTSDPGTGAVSTLAADLHSRERTHGYSVYGSALYATGALELSLGGRFGEDVVEIDQEDRLADTVFAIEDRYDIWGVTGAARLRVAEDLTLLASAVRGSGLSGYDPEGFAAIGVPFLDVPHDWTFEAGVEAALFGDAVNLRLVGFHVQADNSPLPYGSGMNLLSAREADLRSSGAELELRMVPLRGLDVNLTAGYQDARYESAGAAGRQLDLCRQQLSLSLPASACGIGVVTAAGELAEPVFAPDVTLGGRASYDIYIPYSESYVTPSVGIDYRSDMQTEISNTTLFAGGEPVGGSLAESRLLVNAGLAIRTDDDWWMLAVDCRNCLDERYTDSSFGYYSYLGEPMTWSISARRKF